MERSNFPHRNLGEDDEELLNGIWAGLEMPDDRPDADGRDFDDVKRRIRRRVRRRWMSRAALAGSAAAIVAAVVLVVRQPGVLPEPDAFAQLQQMGVTVERPQVVMTADDGMRLGWRMRPVSNGVPRVKWLCAPRPESSVPWPPSAN